MILLGGLAAARVGAGVLRGMEYRVWPREFLIPGLFTQAQQSGGYTGQSGYSQAQLDQETAAGLSGLVQLF